jgi:Spy/CpxP family protein refolding chaperone
MRKSRMIGYAVAAILSVGTVAQAQSTPTQPDHQRHGMGRGARGVRGGPGGAGLLRGATLSDAEKAKVKEIHAKYVAEAKTLRESLRPAMQDVRAARQKRDSAGARAAWEKTAGDRQKLEALMQRQRAEIRAALTPANQKVFDANATKLEQRRAEMKERGKGERGGRAGLRGRRGVRQS